MVTSACAAQGEERGGRGKQSNSQSKSCAARGLARVRPYPLTGEVIASFHATMSFPAMSTARMRDKQICRFCMHSFCAHQSVKVELRPVEKPRTRWVVPWLG